MKLNFKRIKKKFLKINLTSVLFIAMTLITSTFAWIAYSKVVSGNTELDIIGWKINLTENSTPVTNEIGINIDKFYPGSEEITKTYNISNEGDIGADVSYKITYIRIFDTEYDISDQELLFDTLSQNYPFTINFYIANNSIGPNEDTNFMYSIKWPYESGDDELDTTWSTDAYNFSLAEQALYEADSTYEIRDAIEIEIELVVVQNPDYTEREYTLGETKLLNTSNDTECSSLSSTCLNHYTIGYGKYIVDPLSTSLNSINASQISNQSGTPLSFKDIINVIKTDIIDTNIVIDDLSNRTLGNSSTSTYSSIKNKIIENNGYITFKSNIFNYLSSNTCYWVNESYDSTHTFAIKNIDSNTIELYPELNTSSCKYLNVVKTKIEPKICNTSKLTRVDFSTIDLNNVDIDDIDINLYDYNYIYDQTDNIIYEDDYYIYIYKKEWRGNEYNPQWFDISEDGYGVKLKETLRGSLEELTVSPCSVIVNENNVKKPIVSASSMLFAAHDLSYIDLSEFDTSNVINMDRMFYLAGSHASTIEIKGLEIWNTSNVKDMIEVFAYTGCNIATSWKISNLSKWDTSNVETMWGMFRDTGRNEATTFELNGIENWDTSNVKYMDKMFYDAAVNATYSLDLSGWNVNNVTSYSSFSTRVSSKIISPTWVH